ncbi:MAG: cysteine--tRNA ligase [Natronospirillum sp.]|uniref:cysteine--tRNA ligase n=1 Tax=Natronospirillum sp. TaxID=2812955 RepID=UPI0025DF8C7D|nr:cysteine--tRNA ligase [Natronospirillum sp.]MCH8551859.1 cysteine--tRNA ligase [Natronospirillum sp.]
MALQIYNSLHNRKEPFTPMDPERVTMYVCGPTVYNFVHIGNARPAVVFDTLVRLLHLQYPRVDYARNITDIDDKINRAAHDAGEPISTYTERYTTAYHEDMAALHNAEPTIEPLATDNLDMMQALIERLIERGFAYEAEGHVLFRVNAMPDYGKLSKRRLEDMQAGARVEVAAYKEDPMDFVLWKPSTEAHEPGWDSPWGYGRPGWHIECTAMINRHLGPTIDIHGGGHDLMFPHHENEVAQGTCCHDEPEEYVRYWMHNGMINVEGEKMSKSLGNFITVRELLASYPGEQLRLALLSAQYRSVLNWSDDLLTQSRQTLDRFYGALRDSADLAANSPVLSASELQDSSVVKALCDDLNTPQAIAELHQCTHVLYDEQADSDKKQRARALLVQGAQLLGLLNHEPESWFKTLSRGTSSITDERIEALLADRQAAKKARDFQRADEIRAELDAAGVEIQDTREGTRWQWK